MIKTKNLVPEVYYNKSRDFQLLGRIFDIALNYNKTCSDMVLNSATMKNSDAKLLDLTAKTIGFESRHFYNQNDLIALSRSFKSIMFKKGTITGIKECVNVLLKAQDIQAQAKVDCKLVDDLGNLIYNVDIVIPEELTDTILLEDLLDYILPAGFTFTITRAVANRDDYIDRVAIDTSAVTVSQELTKDLGSTHRYGTVEAGGDDGTTTGNSYIGVVTPSRVSEIEED